MKKTQLCVATCQFAVSGRIQSNADRICSAIGRAAEAGAHIAHFPESALSGYGGIDVPNFVDYPWALLQEQTERVMARAAELGIWVVVGSAHRLENHKKPHNCLYLIDDRGQLVDRYDKRFCLRVELRRYTPGTRWVTFELCGIRCALLICFDVRFPEVYRELYQQGVQCVFQSFYNARQKGPSVHSDIMQQSMQCRAASNKLWVSMSNASGHYSPYASCFIRPDGKIQQKLQRGRAGLMLNVVDAEAHYYDPMAEIRELAMTGRLNNGADDFQDPRSDDVHSL